MLIGLACKDRPKYLDRTLKSLVKSGFFEFINSHKDKYTFAAFISPGFDTKVRDLLEAASQKYGFSLNYNYVNTGYIDQFLIMSYHSEALNYDKFMLIESDVIVSKNFIEYVDKVLESRTDWSVFNFYQTDDRPHVKLSNNVCAKLSGPQYGTCMVAMKNYAPEIVLEKAKELSIPFDVAIGKTYIANTFDNTQLLFCTPSVCEHIGVISGIKAPFHKAHEFRGEDFDCLTLLT